MGSNNIANVIGTAQLELLALTRQLKDTGQLQNMDISNSIRRLEESLLTILHNFVVDVFEAEDYHIPKECKFCHRKVEFDIWKIKIPATISASEVSISNVLILHCPECGQAELPNITVTTKSDNIPQCTCGWYNVPPAKIHKELYPQGEAEKVKVEVLGHKCPKCGEEYYSEENVRYFEQLEGRQRQNKESHESKTNGQLGKPPKNADMTIEEAIRLTREERGNEKY
ncbi:hypothetical protein [Paenibacillus sp. FSL R7-0333]|uniref:hypothetical protein n=1 Tax=Paenibacillus sp. FSL R7-0333 TaxID=1926587 RepID=UPI00096D3B5A|nr:hypothetical protein BK146_32355 [Paenibacillus sp. FSL R7-0333]